MTYIEAVAYLDAHVGLGVRPGLDRITRLLQLMGDPHLEIPVIHIAGTNGKTTTALLVSALITGHGLTTGTFTSPHLETIEERFRIDDEIATEEEFAQSIADVAPFADALEAEAGERPTYFELTAAAAFAFFAERAVDVAVVEVGLGGRLDATNVVRPEVAVVTTVGLDHTEYLGDTLERIAVEKLAIAKPGSVLITGELPDAVESIAEHHAAAEGLDRRAIERDFSVDESRLAVGGWVASVDGLHGQYEEVYLPLHGRHQVTNLAVAIAATEAFFGRELDTDAVQEAIAEVQSPGRIEVVRHDPLVVIDGAHNEASMAVLAETLEYEFPDLAWTVIFGVLGDKDIESMLGHLEPRIGRLIVTEADSPRSIPVGQLAAMVRRSLPDIASVEVAATVPDAVVEAMGTTDADGAILVTGSLYVVGEARPHLTGR
ncbi:MAG: bifunctional folylpolyglutamate synthase/dihydrofolate synthase [Acidimicrobiia bacterium]|nr:bifunctional folylpolyglutamate synthase/dihydrofolate synthase [Acidimicrobiia bacterium]